MNTHLTNHGAYIGASIVELPKSLVELDAEQHAAVDAVLKETIHDPYAELKAAHAAGKVIEYRGKTANGFWKDWQDAINPQWHENGDTEYRTKPEPEPFQLPQPPPGIEWHRKDGWKPDDLPQGYRPLVFGERRTNEDEWTYDDGNGWRLVAHYGPEGEVGRGAAKHRTTRPLEFQHLGKTWTWHKPGDPMPCDGEQKIEWVLPNEVNGPLKAQAKASDLVWAMIIGWRYITKTVDLGPEDVPPGSVFRMNHFSLGVWILPCATSSNGISYANPDRECEELMWPELNGDFQINRSIPLTGRWNPDAWEPCSKEVAA